MAIAAGYQRRRRLEPLGGLPCLPVNPLHLGPLLPFVRLSGFQKDPLRFAIVVNLLSF